MLEAGEKFERYVVEASLGDGGMGAVYRVHDPRLDRRVALKVLHDSSAGDDAARSEATARLLREARAAAALMHPNAVSIFDVGEAGSTPYITMELVDGDTLRTFVGDAKVPLSERIRWLADTAKALSAAHRAGLVHRDVKPENVMRRTDGVIKVLDFGIARRAATEVDPNAPTATPAMETLTAAGVRVGTPLYMTPEQIHGDPVDGRTDQFAWGVLAYELLTGQIPWKSKNDALGLVASILTQKPPGLRSAICDLPPEVEAVVLRALSKSPADRYTSMDDIVLAIEPYATATGPSIPPAPSASTPPRRASPPPQRAPQRPLSTTDFRRYSDDEIRAILQRSLEQQDDDRISHQELVEVARELGIDERAVREASHQVAEKAAKPAQEREVAKRKLTRDFAMYAVINVFLALMFGFPGWQKWVLFGWGLGLALKAVRLAFPVAEKDKKPKKDRRSAKERDADRRIEEGARELLSVTSRVRMRIASTEEGGRDEAAEREAIEAEEQGPERRARAR